MRQTSRRLSAPTDEDLRRTLEGGADELEAARLRLDALVPAIESWRWRTRVREVADIARAVVRSLPALRPLVARTRRRASSESWSKTSKLRAVLELVHAQLQALDAAVASREYESLEQLLVATVGLTRKVPIHERETAAAEVLDVKDPLVQRLQRFQEEVAKVFGRPRGNARAVGFTFEDHERLRPVWRDGEAALAEAWARIARVDSTGGVERWLRSRAAVAPRQSARVKRNGPTTLAAAEFWRGWALAQRTQYVTEHFAPARVHEDEESEALSFVLRRHGDGAAVLGDDSRAALLMLAHEMMGGAPGRAPLTGGVARVREWAALADELPRDDEDWVRLRDSLRLVMSRTVGPVLPPLKRTPGIAPRKVEQVLADFFPPSPRT